ncbi:MAG: O-antigen ligase family protein [Promethearchaeota archaeon]
MIKILFELVLVNLFIINLSLGTISNFSTIIFLLKGLGSLLIILVMIINVKLNNERIQQLFVNHGFKKLLIPLFLFISYMSITLTYSSNPAYGYQKILNFSISVVPSVFVFYYLLKTLSPLRTKVFIFSIILISIISVAYILVDYPFDQSTIYEYKAGRWSHVIYGRMVSSFAVVLILYLCTLTDKIKIILFSFFTAIAIYGTYLSALRSAFVGLLLVVGGMLIISVWFVIRSYFLDSSKTRNNELKTVKPHTDSFVLNPLGIVVTILFCTLMIGLIPKEEIINFRFDNLSEIEEFQFRGDPGIHSRLDYWELSLEIFSDNPVVGVGMGGFSSFHSIELYPHNIILEVMAEGGIVGLLVFSALFVVLFKLIYRYSLLAFVFLLFAFWLAMFSKEISSQITLWIGIAFTGLVRNREMV